MGRDTELETARDRNTQLAKNRQYRDTGTERKQILEFVGILWFDTVFIVNCKWRKLLPF